MPHIHPSIDIEIVCHECNCRLYSHIRKRWDGKKESSTDFVFHVRPCSNVRCSEPVLGPVKEST